MIEVDCSECVGCDVVEFDNKEVVVNINDVFDALWTYFDDDSIKIMDIEDDNTIKLVDKDGNKFFISVNEG
jgi:hypothetical protein